MLSLDNLPAGKSLLTTKLRELTKDDPNVGIWVTGHSLGGGLATVMAARILDEMDRGAKFNLKGLYTYGSPRVGNDEFVTRFNARTAARGVQVVRFRKANDVVTAIPGVFMGYKHVGKLAFLTDDKLEFGASSDPDYGSKSMDDHDIRGYYTRIGKQRSVRAELDACESTGTDRAALGR
jgi:pimeloyl-ACP methyl ester carboxylesterase